MEAFCGEAGSFIFKLRLRWGSSPVQVPMSENHPLQQLKGQFSVDPAYYSTKNMEIDFMLQHDASLIPIEVKGEEDWSAPSFRRFIRRICRRLQYASRRWAIIWTGRLPIYRSIWQGDWEICSEPWGINILDNQQEFICFFGSLRRNWYYYDMKVYFYQYIWWFTYIWSCIFCYKYNTVLYNNTYHL